MPHHAGTTKLGIVSTYIPRRCGLATYTADVRQALTVATDDLEPVVVAIDRDGLTYGDEVVAVIRQDVVKDYIAAADAMLAAGVSAVLIQHEYGIFGGPNGAHVLALTKTLTERGIPYLVTLHTVLSRPTPGQAAVLRALCARAARVTVFTETARRMVIRSGVATGHQIAIVPHGAPVILRSEPSPALLRPELVELLAKLRDKPVLSTFGLISPGKGIDIAIDALAEVVRHHPDTHYLIAGATHPEVVRRAGESYRQSLHEQVERLGLRDRVHFFDAFLTDPELAAVLRSTTLFVTPYRSPEQICSGALTFAIAAGCPAVSTAYRYAEDLLRGGGGRLVPCDDTGALAGAVVELLDDPAALTRERAAAEAIGARITWPAVAVRTADLVQEVARQAVEARGELPLPLRVAPALRLEHLRRITDEIGIIQFADGGRPDPASGYCVDDEARLAIVAAELLAAGREREVAGQWLRQSVRFLDAAYDHGTGLMHNVLSYGGTWQDWPHAGDHVGRAVWGLGVVHGTPAVPPDLREAAGSLLDQLTPNASRWASLGLRTGAYALLGLTAAGRPAAEIAPLVQRLDAALEMCRTPDWRWFEPELTYDNARLPQAMLAGAAALGDPRLVGRAVDALDWYLEHVGLTSGMLRNVGNVWHRRGEANTWGDDGDEQPLDAAACVEALVAAWRQTGMARYGRQAVCAYAWFLGRNRAGVRLYVDRTGGCHDGLSASDANANQGAESTLAYYQALLSLVGAGLAALPDRPAATRSTRPSTSTRLAATGSLTAASTLSTTGTVGTTGSLSATDRRTAGRDRVVPPATGQPPALRRGHRTRRTTEGPPDAR
jgi:glycosyltransferase involved in cell wall biosynthesis